MRFVEGIEHDYKGEWATRINRGHLSLEVDAQTTFNGDGTINHPVFDGQQTSNGGQKNKKRWWAGNETQVLAGLHERSSPCLTSANRRTGKGQTLHVPSMPWSRFQLLSG